MHELRIDIDNISIFLGYLATFLLLFSAIIYDIFNPNFYLAPIFYLLGFIGFMLILVRFSHREVKFHAGIISYLILICFIIMILKRLLLFLK